MAEEMERRAKLFKNGRSQAVRLPWDMRFAGTEVRIRRDGEKVILEPVEAAAVGERKGSPDWDAVREEMAKAGPGDAEFRALVDEEIQKLKAKDERVG